MMALLSGHYTGRCSV